MLPTLQVATLLLVALALAPALAHALELPGKKRLPKDTYLAVQPIYYPGFTLVGGFGEFASLFATLTLVFFTPSDTPAFWLTLSALIALLVMHAIFWVFTQPVNTFWLREQELKGAGAAFFRMRRGHFNQAESDWRALRDQWEYSHVARAFFALVALALFATAIAVT